MNKHFKKDLKKGETNNLISSFKDLILQPAKQLKTDILATVQTDLLNSNVSREKTSSYLL